MNTGVGDAPRPWIISDSRVHRGPPFFLRAEQSVNHDALPVGSRTSFICSTTVHAITSSEYGTEFMKCSTRCAR
jgi:hypothetical protein